jgi:hypothetical protein
LLGFLYIVLTYLNVTPNRPWIFSWATNYVISGIGVFIGIILVGYGVHTRRVLHEYVRKVETLTEEKARQAEVLRQKETALRRTKEEVGRKEAALRLTKGKLRASVEKAKRKTRQMHRIRGKLGDRSRRLKEIERIAKVKKKKK